MLETNFDNYLELAKKYPDAFRNTGNAPEIILDREKLIKGQKMLYYLADYKHRPRDEYRLGIVAQDEWTVVLCDLVKYPDGSYGGYARTLNRVSQLERTAKDVVILTKLDKKLLLIKHFRHEDRAWHWECPRGFAERSLSAHENAAKEISEETSLSVNTLIRLDDAAERCAYFIADCYGEIRQKDKFESISQTVLVTPDDMRKMIINCEINDQYTLRAFLLAELQGLV